MLITKKKYNNFINSGFSLKREELELDLKERTLKRGRLAPLHKISLNEVVIKKSGTYMKLKASLGNNTFLSTPVVLAFYSALWGEHGIQFLRALNSIQDELNWRGAELLILSADDPKHLVPIINENNLSLNIFQDQDNKIAREFGAYQDEKPVWKYISGIDENVSYLSVFAISKTKEILYQHIDLGTDKSWISKITPAIHSALS